MADGIVWWVGFVALIFGFIILDLTVFHRKVHEVKLKEAVFWSLFWVTLGLGFNVMIYWTRGAEAGLQFFTGYVLEKSLSVDNLFVFFLIFSFFRIPKRAQHKVLFWGMLGALVMRMGFIFIGAEYLSRVLWLMYFFGAFLIVSAIKLCIQEEIGIKYKKSLIMRGVRRIIPITHEYKGAQFFIKENGSWVATHIFLAVIAVEFVDLFYAVDSIPAILAITQDKYIVYTSNIFALLGLKSFYFVVVRLLFRYHYMRYGLAAILALVGIKAIIDPFYYVSNNVVLVFIFVAYATTFVLSLIYPKKPKITHE